MTYAQYSTIETTDLYNTLTGNGTPPSAPGLAATWNASTGSAGYGQNGPATVQIATGNSIRASEWANLVNYTGYCASHQGTAITSVSAPVAGGTIAYISAIPSNLLTIYNSRLNAVSTGTSFYTTTQTSTSWSSVATFTQTATFANGNAARYFFNSGGQLQISCAHSSGTSGINLLFNNLASNIGAVILSAPSSGSISVAGSSYTGITKVGGGGSTPTTLPNNGYYALTGANANVFTQLASTGPSGYLSTFIRILVKSNGTQGVLGDAGSVITFTTLWDEVPDGYTVSPGCQTFLVCRPPLADWISNTWGTITLAGSVAVS